MDNAAAIVAGDEVWSEQSITWATKPHSGPALATWTVWDTTPVEIDVTEQVREALGGDRRLALRIFAPKRKRGSAYVQYGSREGDPAARPQLILKAAGELQSRVGTQNDITQERRFSLPVVWASQFRIASPIFPLQEQ